jgi:glycosyltransferase involved in cell wall biosynthesis
MVSDSQRAITKRIVNSVQPSDWLAFVSEHARQDFLAFKSHPEDRTRTIHNGVDHLLFHPPQHQNEINAVLNRFQLHNRPFAMTLSSMAPHKNLGLILSIWPTIHRRHPDAVLIIAGGKSQDGALLRRATQEGDQPGVIFTGFISDKDFSALAATCKAFLFPSLYEGFGLPPLEAMACGAVVVASARTSLPEIMATAGKLLDPEDADAWVEALAEAISTPVSPQARQRAIAHAQNFYWEKTASEYTAYYRHAMACS